MHYLKISFKEILSIYCAEPKRKGDLLIKNPHLIANRKLTQCANVLQNPYILGIVAEFGLIAKETRYNARCISQFCRKASQQVKCGSNAWNNEKSLKHVIKCVELQRNGDTAPVFKLSNQGKIYATKLEALGDVSDTRIHTQDSRRVCKNIYKIWRIISMQGHLTC